MFIATVPNRKSPPTLLLRESYREGGKVKTRTLANVTHWPKTKIEALRVALKGGRMAEPLHEAFEVVRSRPHGHVAAVLGTVRHLGLDRLLGLPPGRDRNLCIAMIVARLLWPASKLATARGWQEETCTSTLGEVLELEQADANDLYAAMDKLLPRQGRIETALAKRHLSEGALVLYDVTSTYFEGRTCPLALRGHSRDDKPDRLQIVVGLLTNAEGCPVAVTVFEGNTADPKTLSAQITKVKDRFGLERIIFVGDRGMLTEARIREELYPVGLDWITALRAPAIQYLVDQGTVQPSLFDAVDLAEVTSPDYPGERLMICRNPFLADERTRKREELLVATEKLLTRIAEAVNRPKRPLRGEVKIALRVGKVWNRYKMAKHFKITITDTSFFGFERDHAAIARESALDGFYVIRTSVSAKCLSAPQTVAAYKRLASVERAFRCLKGLDLQIRPIHHRLAHRVQAHVLICMLAYYVEWHMRKALAPLLFDDDDPASAEAARPSPVAPAKRSAQALRKAAHKQTNDETPVHSFPSLLRDIATIVKNRVKPVNPAIPPFDKITTPTVLQQRALDMLGVRIASV